MMSVSICASSPSTRAPMDFSLKTRSWLEIPIIFARSWTRIFPIYSRDSSKPLVSGPSLSGVLGLLLLGGDLLRLLGRPVAAEHGRGRRHVAAALMLALREGTAGARHEVLVRHRRTGGGGCRLGGPEGTDVQVGHPLLPQLLRPGDQALGLLAVEILDLQRQQRLRLRVGQGLDFAVARLLELVGRGRAETRGGEHVRLLRRRRD